MGRRPLHTSAGGRVVRCDRGPRATYPRVEATPRGVLARGCADSVTDAGGGEPTSTRVGLCSCGTLVGTRGCRHDEAGCAKRLAGDVARVGGRGAGATRWWVRRPRTMGTRAARLGDGTGSGAADGGDRGSPSAQGRPAGRRSAGRGDGTPGARRGQRGRTDPPAAPV